MSACPQVGAEFRGAILPQNPPDRTSRGCTDRNSPQSHICKIYCRAVWLIKIQIYKTFGINHKKMQILRLDVVSRSALKTSRILPPAVKVSRHLLLSRKWLFSKSLIESLASVNILNASFEEDWSWDETCLNKQK